MGSAASRKESLFAKGSRFWRRLSKCSPTLENDRFSLPYKQSAPVLSNKQNSVSIKRRIGSALADDLHWFTKLSNSMDKPRVKEQAQRMLRRFNRFESDGTVGK